MLIPQKSRVLPVTQVRGIHSSIRRALSVHDAARILARSDAPVLRGFRTHDHMTFDAQTIDSTGAFLVGELERLDQRLHLPLADVTWSRDIDLREDVSMADEDSSFTNSTFAAAQSIPGSNKNFISKTTNAVAGIGLDISKTVQPLTIWASQIGWTLPELQSAMRLGRPVDQQKFEFLQMKHQMDTDEQVYVGDTVLNLNGLLNHSALTNTGNAITGNWATASPSQILADVNSLLTSVYNASAYAVVPPRLLVDPTSFGILVSTLISTAGNISIYEFIRMNSLANAKNGRPLEIQPLKWLLGTNNANTLGPAATNSMFAYDKNPIRVRFPMVPLQRTPLEWRDLRQLVTYFGRLGATEMVYPEVVGRRSGLG